MAILSEACEISNTDRCLDSQIKYDDQNKAVYIIIYAMIDPMQKKHVANPNHLVT
jgi:hypothetical protein